MLRLHFITILENASGPKAGPLRLGKRYQSTNLKSTKYTTEAEPTTVGGKGCWESSGLDKGNHKPISNKLYIWLFLLFGRCYPPQEFLPPCNLHLENSHSLSLLVLECHLSWESFLTPSESQLHLPLCSWSTVETHSGEILGFLAPFSVVIPSNLTADRECEGLCHIHSWICPKLHIADAW